MSKTTLRTIFDAAIAAVDPLVCVPPAVADLVGRNATIFAVGKAGASMARALLAAGVRAQDVRVITRQGYEDDVPGGVITLAGHPLPTDTGAQAAEGMLARAAELNADDLLIVALSGGASSLATLPVEGVSLEELRALTEQLLASGASIREINAVRRRLSRFHGGRLAAAAHPARVVTVAISDVPGDHAETIGSGPTVGDGPGAPSADQVLAHYGVEVPLAVGQALFDTETAPIPVTDPRLVGTDYRVVATAKTALDAAAVAARAEGYDVEMRGDHIEGEAADVAREHAQIALRYHGAGRRVALLSGGELTVSGVGDEDGGRCREYALALAIALDGAPGISALAADTDGVDGQDREGPAAAGAFVTPTSLMRARDLGLDGADMLARHASGAFFNALGDALITGPTRTNVSDLRAILVGGDKVESERAGDG